ncbi:bifunctional aminoglycoside phosphotransferase/ATP-binding protein [Rhizobium sp. 18065]|uniref:bifunctional aminoglycoside phosphotransferase/ATP-binding protein n=1 Tax=Rhizobium sp. 18065 TaxID=2681411 RepID=UPI001358543B|nr:bifunctional aminoglycoside phosphotransferase/ATP-binding protein [Rhizobium sp. 18065]
MEIQDQSAVIAFLSKPETYGASDAVEIIETHISIVFLVGDRAFKLKRAVKLPYADFSTCALRHHFCERELELNGRAAPEIYLGVRTIRQTAEGTLHFGGDGTPLDYVVEMTRFAQDDLFDRMAAGGRLTAALLEETAERIAAFHKDAPVSHAERGAANMAGVLDINEAGFATGTIFEPAALASLTSAFRHAWTQYAALLDQRERQGQVRLCHGDLHLRNLFLGPEGPRMFDCIDFNEKIATCDVLYDLAFLLMDLWHRDFPHFANVVVNRYLDRTGDDAGFALLPFFMAVRAAVRAHVTATQIAEIGDASGAAKASARSYFHLAEKLLADTSPCLVAIGGFSGSGKSTLAEALAPVFGAPPGARILESDRIRKAMFSTNHSETLPPEAYRPEISRKVYDQLNEKARAIVLAGGSVLVNAVFDRQSDRQAIEAMATECKVPFIGIWLTADAEILRARVAARPKGDSDATPDILDLQLTHDTGAITWHQLDAKRTINALVDEIKSRIDAQTLKIG